MHAHYQCMMRDIPIGPTATYNAWKEKGRQVRRAEKALVLYQPPTVKRDRGEGEDPDLFTALTYWPRWFALTQPGSADLEPTAVSRP